MAGEAKPTTEFGARVPTEDYEEFNRQFPQYGAATWFIRTALSELLASVRDDGEARDRVRSLIDKMVKENMEARTASV